MTGRPCSLTVFVPLLGTSWDRGRVKGRRDGVAGWRADHTEGRFSKACPKLTGGVSVPSGSFWLAEGELLLCPLPCVAQALRGLAYWRRR